MHYHSATFPGSPNARLHAFFLSLNANNYYLLKKNHSFLTYNNPPCNRYSRPSQNRLIQCPKAVYTHNTLGNARATACPPPEGSSGRGCDYHTLHTWWHPATPNSERAKRHRDLATRAPSTYQRMRPLGYPEHYEDVLQKF